MKTIFILISLIKFIRLLVAFEPTDSYDRNLFLSQSKTDYRLFWKVVNDEIIFEAHVGTLGWIGLGFSPNGGMPGSDIVIGGVKDKIPYLYDCFATANARPDCQEHSDYALLYAAENGTHTVLKYKRKLSTCDKKDWKITNDTVRLIWAYNPEDAENSTSFKVHTENGHKSIMLLEQGKESRTKIPSDVIYYDLNATNVSMPTKTNTLYLCKIFKMPDKPKHHIIKYEVLIQPGNEKFLHHIVVFHCLYDMEKFVNKQEPCFSDDHTVGSEMYKCTSRYLAGWGIGAGAVVYPENLGQPIFEKGRSPYIMVEYHYDNQKFVQGAFDNSGIRFYLTPTLRPTEIGSMITGLGFDNNTVLLPPGQKTIKMFHACDYRCTQALPESGINIMGVFLHQHMQGKAVRLRHIRDGVELAPIAEDNYYDFNFQEQRYLQKPRLVLPNDTLLVECEWQTMDRKNMTFGGYSSSEEMCLVFIDYYPKTDNLLSCLGGPSQESYAEGFGAKILSKAGPSPIVLEGTNGIKITLSSYAAQINWNADKSSSDPTKLQTAKMEILQQKLNNGLFIEYCAKRLNANDTTTPAFGDMMGTVAGQQVFNPNGVKLIEKIEEHLYPPHPIVLPNVSYTFPDTCGTNLTSTSSANDNFTSFVTDKPITFFANDSSIVGSNVTIKKIFSTTPPGKGASNLTPSQILALSLFCCCFYMSKCFF